ncbi:MAG: 50S ribosomal protein L3 [Methanobacteriota archaeon]|nr:MAG: 50S ribosomal protein L3 [Euryarchaeota archaeon]HIC75801.1 50S ribosomal protein L3 [Candidatus Poseidoniales archaeon]
MADRHRPKRGSMGFSPRKRAIRPFARITSWPETESSEIRVQGFAGWKAGMTHVLMRDTNPHSTSAGQEIRKAVTVVEVPPMKVLAVRGYHMTPYGMQTAGEIWADSSSGPDGLMPRFANQTRGDRDIEEGRKPAKRAGRIPVREGGMNGDALAALTDSNLCEVRLIVATQPALVKSVPSKTPVIMEVGLVGGDTGAKLEWAHERLGGEIGIDDVYEAGKELDVVGITKGKGWQGVIKRFGVKLLSHKNSKRRRQIGNMGDFGTGYVRKTIRQAGQMGYHKRTELNKRILRISNPGESDVTPAGGFLHYGEVTNPYMVLEGSLPGPAKRLLRFRDPVRPHTNVFDVDLTYVSTSSKQGV